MLFVAGSVCGVGGNVQWQYCCRVTGFLVCFSQSGGSQTFVLVFASFGQKNLFGVGLADQEYFPVNEVQGDGSAADNESI
jgi:hypothetical protein